MVSCKAITIAVYFLYPALLFYLALSRNDFLLKAVLVPAISFVALSFIRRVLNFPRPYERSGVVPLYDKKTKGNSFPSRHTFSVFIIALTVLRLNPLAGIILIAAGLWLGVGRVLCGVHYIRDVLSAVAVALISAAVGFYLI